MLNRGFGRALMMGPLLAMAAASMGKLHGRAPERELKFPDYMLRSGFRGAGAGSQKFRDRSKYTGADIRRLYRERGITGPRPPYAD